MILRDVYMALWWYLLVCWSIKDELHWATFTWWELIFKLPLVLSLDAVVLICKKTLTICPHLFCIYGPNSNNSGEGDKKTEHVRLSVCVCVCVCACIIQYKFMARTYEARTPYISCPFTEVSCFRGCKVDLQLQSLRKPGIRHLSSPVPVLACHVTDCFVYPITSDCKPKLRSSPPALAVRFLNNTKSHWHTSVSQPFSRRTWVSSLLLTRYDTIWYRIVRSNELYKSTFTLLYLPESHLKLSMKAISEERFYLVHISY